jgi:opacity protein-like surface antigen
MKTKLFLFGIAMFAITYSGYSQFAFGVSPGLNLNSAYFGYKVSDRLVPYVGLQVLSTNVNVEFRDPGSTETNELSASLIAPTIGARYFISQQNPVRAYFALSISKPFVSGKLEYDGEPDEDFEEAIENISLFGFEIGFGAEYFFSENFSLGGEFGLRSLSAKYEEFDVDFEEEYTVKARLTPTYTKFGLNFYF